MFELSFQNLNNENFRVKLLWNIIFKILFSNFIRHIFKHSSFDFVISLGFPENIIFSFNHQTALFNIIFTSWLIQSWIHKKQCVIYWNIDVNQSRRHFYSNPRFIRENLTIKLKEKSAKKHILISMTKLYNHTIVKYFSKISFRIHTRFNNIEPKFAQQNWKLIKALIVDSYFT